MKECRNKLSIPLNFECLGKTLLKKDQSWGKFPEYTVFLFPKAPLYSHFIYLGDHHLHPPVEKSQLSAPYICVEVKSTIFYLREERINMYQMPPPSHVSTKYIRLSHMKLPFLWDK